MADDMRMNSDKMKGSLWFDRASRRSTGSLGPERDRRKRISRGG